MSFNQFPYTNLHNINLDWILSKIIEAGTAIREFSSRLASAVLTTPQTLTAAQKVQARENIGALGPGDVPDPSGVVRYDQAQTLTSDQMRQARTNIYAGSAADVADNALNIVQLQTDLDQAEDRLDALDAELPATYVSTQITQAFSAAEQAKARSNIGAIGAGEIPSPEGAVLYNAAQQLTALQAAQARSNIGAGQPVREITVTLPYGSSSYTGITSQDVTEAVSAGQPILVHIRQETDQQGIYETISGHLVSYALDAAGTAVQMINVLVLTDGGADLRQWWFDLDQYLPRYGYTDLRAGLVRFDGVQALTTAQKAQARSNIGAVSAAEIPVVFYRCTINTQTNVITPDADLTYNNIVTSINNSKLVILIATTTAGVTQIYDMGRVSSQSAIFNTFSFTSTTLYTLFVTVSASNVYTYDQKTISFTP